MNRRLIMTAVPLTARTIASLIQDKKLRSAASRSRASDVVLSKISGAKKGREKKWTFWVFVGSFTEDRIVLVLDVVLVCTFSEPLLLVSMTVESWLARLLVIRAELVSEGSWGSGVINCGMIGWLDISRWVSDEEKKNK